MEPAEPEELPQNEKLLIEKDGKKRITMQLISRTSLDSKAVAALSEEDKIELILAVKSIHLQYMNIDVIENLEVFSKVMVLFLNNNNIKKIEGLDTLISLEYLALNSNQITKVEGVSGLRNLQGLNLASNQIEFIRGNEFPPNVQLLSLKNNPVALNANYRETLVRNLKELDLLDGEELTTIEKFKLQGIFPTHMGKYAQSMKAIQSRKEGREPKSEVSMLSTGLINEEQALRELKEKTSQLLKRAKEEGAEKQAQQISNFEEKIKVSRRIRQIVANSTNRSQLSIILQEVEAGKTAS